ncbi:MAG: hypothetical protein B7X83_09590, partial [Polynucleobacter sp. 17-46-58]
KTADEWLSAAKDIKGSWWPNYAQWLEQFGGKRIQASKTFGNARYKKLEAAPGKYVKEKVTAAT